MDKRKFEWDPQKEKKNIIKHGINFHTAAKIFKDENRIIYFDYSHSLFERREIAVGKVNDILMVVYTTRIHYNQQYIRIISARLATKSERRKYYGHQKIYY